MISYITESELEALPEFVCVRTTRLTPENAHAMWDLIHNEDYTVYFYDTSLRYRLRSARRADLAYRLKPYDLIIADYLVFVNRADLIQCRLCGDYSFEVLREKKLEVLND